MAQVERSPRPAPCNQEGPWVLGVPVPRGAAAAAGAACDRAGGWGLEGRVLSPPRGALSPEPPGLGSRMRQDSALGLVPLLSQRRTWEVFTIYSDPAYLLRIGKCFGDGGGGRLIPQVSVDISPSAASGPPGFPVGPGWEGCELSWSWSKGTRELVFRPDPEIRTVRTVLPAGSLPQLVSGGSTAASTSTT